MNAFREHHEDSIRFGYRCFDRLLLNGLIQLDWLYQRVVDDLDRLPHAVGLKVAA